jgi:hypothetical protein
MAPKSSGSGARGGKDGLRRQTAERVILVAVARGTMLASLNSTMIAVALPDLLGDFERSPGGFGSWPHTCSPWPPSSR